MAKKAISVDAFMASLVHARAPEVARLRAAILALYAGITERVKWSAPSFCWRGDDRVTFRLQPGDRLEVVLHRGVSVRPADGFSFADPAGMIRWAAPDRGVIVVEADLEAALPALGETVLRWMRATED